MLQIFFYFFKGLPGVDGREGIPGMPGAKVRHNWHISELWKCPRFVAAAHGFMHVIRAIELIFLYYRSKSM